MLDKSDLKRWACGQFQNFQNKQLSKPTHCQKPACVSGSVSDWSPGYSRSLWTGQWSVSMETPSPSLEPPSLPEKPWPGREVPTLLPLLPPTTSCYGNIIEIQKRFVVLQSLVTPINDFQQMTKYILQVWWSVLRSYLTPLYLNIWNLGGISIRKGWRMIGWLSWSLGNGANSCFLLVLHSSRSFKNL